MQWALDYLGEDPEQVRLVQSVAFSLAHGLDIEEIAIGEGRTTDALLGRYRLGLNDIALGYRRTACRYGSWTGDRVPVF